MDIKQARVIAEGVKNLLAPFCERIEIAGSIRRNKPEVKDIEIVCVPKEIPFNTDLFGSVGFERNHAFVEAVGLLGELQEGDPRTGKHFIIKHSRGINIDMYTASLFNWGYIFMIRTGPADYSHDMARYWRYKKYYGKDGNLYKEGEKDPIELKEESDLYDLLKLNFVNPEDRIKIYK